MHIIKMKRIWIFISILILFNRDFVNTRKLSRVDRIEVCNGTANAALRINEIVINNPEGGNVLVNINATLRRELRKEIRFEIFVIRCLNKESLDTCVPFTTLKPINTCALISMSNMAWSGFVNSIKPPISCPFKKGHYTITNGTLDAEKFAFFPIDNFYWRAKVVMIEDKRDFITLCADMRAINIHN